MAELHSPDKRSATNLTARQRVLKRFPKAACIEASGCTFAVFSCGVIDSAALLALAHTKRQAWIEAARKL
jgi:hypothetical protein